MASQVQKMAFADRAWYMDAAPVCRAPLRILDRADTGVIGASLGRGPGPYSAVRAVATSGDRHRSDGVQARREVDARQERNQAARPVDRAGNVRSHNAAVAESSSWQDGQGN